MHSGGESDVEKFRQEWYGFNGGDGRRPKIVYVTRNDVIKV